MRMASLFDARGAMDTNMNVQVFPILLLSLALTACEKLPDTGSASTPSHNQTPSGSLPLNRNMDPQQVQRGRLVYEQHCAACHGLEGRGQPGDWRVRNADGMYPPPPLDDSGHAWHHPTAVLRDAIREGSPPGEGKMPPWKDKLTDREINDVIVYIKSLWSDPIYRRWQEIEQRSMEH